MFLGKLHPMSLVFRAATVSDVGLVRTNNEDSAYVSRRLIALADGIGGMPAGELASDIVIRAMATLDRSAPKGRDPLAALRGAVDAANQQIRDASDLDEANDGMGTTVTAMLIAGDQVALLHVGDSRAYLLQDATLSQLTKDDTFVQSLVDQGLLTAAEARSHPRRSIVTQAVQGLEYEPTLKIVPIRAGDRLLLCSDGLSDFVADEAIGQTLRSEPDPKACARRLVKLALDVGAPDNVTVVVADAAAA